MNARDRVIISKDRREESHRIAVFARKARPGWNVWGAEAPAA